MTRIALMLTACVALSACALGGRTDGMGNEGLPFGTDVSAPADLITYTAQNRPDLIVWCHDNKGYLSDDGYNCVVVHGIIAPDWCVQVSVYLATVDESWRNAVCNGWRPAIL